MSGVASEPGLRSKTVSRQFSLIFIGSLNMLSSLLVVPVSYRIYFKILIITNTFKAIHDMPPSYISDLVRIRSCYSYSLRWHHSIVLEHPKGHMLATLVACEQAFGRAGWGEGKAKRPVDKHLGPPFHGTRCASDPDASSYWREH